MPQEDILERYTSCRRVIKLYLRISNARFGLTLQDLIDEADVHKRTIQRDIAFLKDERLIESRGEKLFTVGK